MKIRVPTLDELYELQCYIQERHNTDVANHRPAQDIVDLRQAIVHVCELDGKVIGFCAARLVWQIEPLAIIRHDVPINTKRRAVYMLFKATMQWLTLNGSPVRQLITLLDRKYVRKWAEKMGFNRWYKTSQIFGRDF